MWLKVCWSLRLKNIQIMSIDEVVRLPRLIVGQHKSVLQHRQEIYRELFIEEVFTMTKLI